MKLTTVVILLVGLLCSCRKGMVEDGRIKPLEKSDYFSNGMTARPPVEGTVPRDQLDADSAYFQGEINGRLVTGFPMVLTTDILARGQERFDIYCSVCHSRTGEGNGMVVQRGFPQPPTYHQSRLRDAPPGYFFGVITRGYGVMYAYADRVKPSDRWAIVAYIRALQRSQDARWNDVPEAERNKLGSP